MSISSVNGDPRGDYPVWGPEDEEFLSRIGDEGECPLERGLRRG
jgi:hypothetical protein